MANKKSSHFNKDARADNTASTGGSPSDDAPPSAAPAEPSVTASDKKRQPAATDSGALQEENKALIVQLQRLQAEFENYQKRSERKQQAAQDKGAFQLVKELLEICDALEIAVRHEARDLAVEGASPEDAPRKSASASAGLRLLYAKLMNILEKAGMMPINALGRLFDPHLHEALLQDCLPEQPDDLVLEELQRGYLFRGKVLRTAKVRVNTHMRVPTCESEDESETSGETPTPGKAGKAAQSEKDATDRGDA